MTFEKTGVRSYSLVPSRDDRAEAMADLIDRLNGKFGGELPRDLLVEILASAFPEVDDFEVLVWFNLEWPLEPQLKRTEKFLRQEKSYSLKNKGLRTVKTRMRVENYPRYLRLLDGETVSASTRKLATEIFPKETNDYPDYRGNAKVRDSLRPAKKLRDSDYRMLPLLREK